MSNGTPQRSFVFGQRLIWRGSAVVTARGETIQPDASVVFLNPGQRSDLAACACPPDGSLPGLVEAPLVLFPVADLAVDPRGGWDGTTLTPELLRALLQHPQMAEVARGVVEATPELVRPLLPPEVFSFFDGLLAD